MDIAHRLKEIEKHVGRLSPVQKILLGTDGSVTRIAGVSHRPPGISPGPGNRQS